MADAQHGIDPEYLRPWLHAAGDAAATIAAARRREAQGLGWDPAAYLASDADPAAFRAAAIAGSWLIDVSAAACPAGGFPVPLALQRDVWEEIVVPPPSHPQTLPHVAARLASLVQEAAVAAHSAPQEKALVPFELPWPMGALARDARITYARSQRILLYVRYAPAQSAATIGELPESRGKRTDPPRDRWARFRPYIGTEVIVERVGYRLLVGITPEGLFILDQGLPEGYSGALTFCDGVSVPLRRYAVLAAPGHR